MGFKEEFQKEKSALQNIKRPFESAAFLLFAILVGQQLIYLIRNLIVFIRDKTFLSANGWLTSNLMGWVNRILNLGSTKWIFVIIAIAAYLLYYFLIYFFVWNYAKKNNLAKWTWTVFVVFGPTFFFAPPYIWFIIYAFRPYLARFAKRAVEEFKSFDPNEPFPEDVEDPEMYEEPEVYEEPEMVEEEENKQ